MSLLLLLWACTAGDGDVSVNNGDPFIRILSPQDGETVCGDPLDIEMDVANLTLVEPVEDTDDAVPGTGHIDVMLNGQDADMVWDTQASIPGVADAEWQLKVELSYADHTPIEPYAGDLIYITVADEVCL